MKKNKKEALLSAKGDLFGAKRHAQLYKINGFVKRTVGSYFRSKIECRLHHADESESTV